MTKKEIVKQIAEEFKETQLKVKQIVQATFDAVIATLETEGRIELRNFGVFEVKRRKPRRARNPRTNKPVEVEAKNVVTFQPGKVMEEKIRLMANPPEPKRKPRKGARPAPDEEPEVPEPVTIGASETFDGTADGDAVLAGAGEAPLKPR